MNLSIHRLPPAKPKKPPAARGRGKAKVEEPVILTLSSDDEEDNSPNTNNSSHTEKEDARGMEPEIVDDVVADGKNSENRMQNTTADSNHSFDLKLASSQYHRMLTAGAPPTS